MIKLEHILSFIWFAILAAIIGSVVFGLFLLLDSALQKDEAYRAAKHKRAPYIADYERSHD